MLVEKQTSEELKKELEDAKGKLVNSTMELMQLKDMQAKIGHINNVPANPNEKEKRKSVDSNGGSGTPGLKGKINKRIDQSQ